MKICSYPPVRQTDISRQLYVTSVGCWDCPPGEAYPPSGHPSDYSFSWASGRTLGDFVLIWVESGSGEVEAEKLGRARLCPGRVLFVPPGVWHRYRPHRSSGWVEKWVCLNGAYVHRLAKKGHFPTESILVELSEHRDLMDQLFTHIHQSAQFNTLGLATAALALFALILSGLELGEDQVATENAPAPADDSKAIVRAACEFIRSHAHLRLGVDEVSRRVGVSRRSLERAFQAHATCGVAGEIERARLERARELLLESSMSVKEAGYTAGFGGPRKFIQAHRRAFGTTPGRMRKLRIGFRSAE